MSCLDIAAQCDRTQSEFSSRIAPRILVLQLPVHPVHKPRKLVLQADRAETAEIKESHGETP